MNGAVQLRSGRQVAARELSWEAGDREEGKAMDLAVSGKVTPWCACACFKQGHALRTLQNEQRLQGRMDIGSRCDLLSSLPLCHTLYP